MPHHINSESSGSGRESVKWPQHVNLTDSELASFRVKLCGNHQRGLCNDSDRCPDSHCLSWQRRNPFEFNYSAKLCPDIEFIKKGSKMTLRRKCTRGRECVFAHSKEEELYHPLMYKTNLCTSYPSCNRHFCPFAHSMAELRHPQTNSKIHSRNELRSRKNRYRRNYMVRQLTEPCRSELSHEDNQKWSLLFKQRNDPLSQFREDRSISWRSQAFSNAWDSRRNTQSTDFPTSSPSRASTESFDQRSWGDPLHTSKLNELQHIGQERQTSVGNPLGCHSIFDVFDQIIKREAIQKGNSFSASNSEPLKSKSGTLFGATTENNPECPWREQLSKATNKANIDNLTFGQLGVTEKEQEGKLIDPSFLSNLTAPNSAANLDESASFDLCSFLLEQIFYKNIGSQASWNSDLYSPISLSQATNCNTELCHSLEKGGWPETESTPSILTEVSSPLSTISFFPNNFLEDEVSSIGAAFCSAD